MNDGEDVTGGRTRGVGKHRRDAGGDTWTPTVPATGRRTQHAGEAPAPEPTASTDHPDHATRGPDIAGPQPDFLPTYGELPSTWPATELPQPRRQEQQTPAVDTPACTAQTATPCSGSAPTSPIEPVPALAPHPRDAAEHAPTNAQQHPHTSDPQDPQALRTKVTLAPSTASDAEQTDDDVRVYLAPPADGLGKFDLGTVPASVTPPRSWRKAAWFATVSSGGVVVALLFAGSFLVQQPTDNQAISGWTERRGSQPTQDGEQFVGPSTPEDTQHSSGKHAMPPNPLMDPSTGQRTGSAPGRPGQPSDPQPPLTGPPAPGTSPSGTPSPDASSTSAPTTTPQPEKPPVSSAPRQTAPYRQLATLDPGQMGDVSEAYLNSVTTNPAKAHELTTGAAHDGGTAALKRKYAEIAYFEVKNISIDQNAGTTVNQVTTTYTDGTSTTEQRTLRFGDDTKIANDGQ